MFHTGKSGRYIQILVFSLPILLPIHPVIPPLSFSLFPMEDAMPPTFGVANSISSPFLPLPILPDFPNECSRKAKYTRLI